MNSVDLRSPIAAVCSEIGRGHPSYLDSVLLALLRLAADSSLGHDPKSPSNPGHVPRLTVPELCTGTSGLAWNLARTAYRLGGRGGPATWLYNRLRSADAKPSGLQLALLGSSLRRQFAGYNGICLVDHPLLAHILASVCRVAYVHGEIAAPGPAAVPDAWRTFVPLESTRQKLLAVGCQPSAVRVTGLIIEPELTAVAETSLQARLARLETGGQLTCGFFLSGARPRPHAHRIITAAASLVRAGHKAVFFWGHGMMRATKVQMALSRQGIPEESGRVIWTRSRRHETERTADLFPSLDVFVAAAHERTNWAVGLGLPMFALLPHIGPFARENFDFATTQGVCLPIAKLSDADSFGTTLTELRDCGRLARMARNGWGRHAITGAWIAACEIIAAREEGAHS